MDDSLKHYAKDIIVTKYILYEPNYEKVSNQIKRNMDQNFGINWNCIVGKAYGFEVSFESKSLLYVRIDENIGVLVWKS